MAVSKNLYTQGFRKKLGGAVWYQRMGDTVIREKAPKIDNPRTVAQMSQRVKLANIVAFYRANRIWMERLAFETRKRWQTVFNRFTQLNLNSNQVPLTKEQVEFSAGIVAPYMVSQGSIPSISYTEESNGRIRTNLLSSVTFNTNMTIAEFSKGLIDANSQIRKGMQLSLIRNFQNTDGIVPTISVDEVEIILNPNDTRPLDDVVNPDIFIAEEESFVYLSRGELDCTGFTLVLSETIGGKTQVSTQFIYMLDYTVYEDYTSIEQINAAIESYGKNDIYFLDSKTDGDSTSMPVSQNILSVDGKTAGQTFYWDWGLPNGATPSGGISVAFSSPVTKLTDCKFLDFEGQPYTGTNAPTVTSTSKNTGSDGTKWWIKLSGKSPNSDNTIGGFSCVADGLALSIRFLRPNNDNGEGITG